MSSLQDRCLTVIEQSGTDTRELKGANIDLPSRMWSRHPVLRIFTKMKAKVAPHPGMKTKWVISIAIDVEYTGVYTLKFKTTVINDERLSEKEKRVLYSSLGPIAPTTWEKTFESLSGELTKEQEEWIKLNAFGQCFSDKDVINRAIESGRKNVLLTEICYLIFGKHKSDYAEVALVNGDDRLTLVKWDCDAYLTANPIKYRTEQALKFMTAFIRAQ